MLNMKYNNLFLNYLEFLLFILFYFDHNNSWSTSTIIRRKLGCDLESGILHFFKRHHCSGLNPTWWIYREIRHSIMSLDQWFCTILHNLWNQNVTQGPLNIVKDFCRTLYQSKWMFLWKIWWPHDTLLVIYTDPCLRYPGFEQILCLITVCHF